LLDSALKITITIILSGLECLVKLQEKIIFLPYLRMNDEKKKMTDYEIHI